MPNMTVRQTFSVGGISLQNRVGLQQISGEVPIAGEWTVPKGYAGTLDTRTDDDTGVVGLSAGHGIVNGTTVDVYWTGGARYGMSATVAANNVTIDGGAGDVLPSSTTAMIVSTQLSIDINFDGDNLQAIVVGFESTDTASTGTVYVNFIDSGASTIYSSTLSEGRCDQEYLNIADGDTNAYTGNRIETLLASCRSVSADATLRVIGIANVSS